MKNKEKWLGIPVLLFVLVFGMTFAGCEEDDPEDKDKPVSKPLVITMSAEIFSYGASGYLIGVYPVGTTPEQAYIKDGLVAGTNDSISGLSVTGTDPIILTIHLINMKTLSKWTGNGTYDIYASFGIVNPHYYKAGSVNFSSGGAEISIDASNEIITQ